MTQSEKILIVDDNKDNVDLLAKRFRSLGYAVAEAFDGEEALEKVGLENPDLLVLDVMMPRIDGFEVCRRLKANPKTRSIPIIMLTAKREVPDKIKGLDTGADDYVTKPFNPRELVARVKSLLARRESEKRQATAEKLGALGQMAEGVAHEVRNPMVAIGGFARRIKDRLPPGDPLKDYAGHIIKEVERLESMVEEIVRFKTIMISPYGRVNLKSLIDETLAKRESVTIALGIRVYADAAEGLPEIQGDEGNLKLALENIIQNSVEAMPGGGELKISVGPRPGKEGWVTLTITDTGRGIAKEDISNVFDPFFTTKMSGAGMGLTLVHRIVTRHGGEVDISSEPGAGTSVSVHLPIKQESPI